MDALELRQLIAGGERPTVDFKREFDSHRECAKDLTCFANAINGWILFGIDDSGEVIGVDDVDAVLLRLDEVANEHCEPPVTILPEVIELDEGPVVAVHVPRGSSRPYRTKSGQHYIRSGTRCRQPSREELLRLFQGVESLYFDEQPVQGTGWSDVDNDEIDSYLRQADIELGPDQSRQALLRNWRCWDGERLTVAGLLLFGNAPTEHLPYAKVIAASFPGTSPDAESLERVEFTGPVLTQIRGCEHFLATHLPTRHSIRGFDPERTPELPGTALREAVVNGVAHRDYTVRGSTRLFVFPDRVEVRTPGKPPNSVDIDSMRQGAAHVPRNPWLYKRLWDAGLVTSLGSGVLRIVRLVLESTGQPIGLEIVGEELVLTLPRPTTS